MLPSYGREVMNCRGVVYRDSTLQLEETFELDRNACCPGQKLSTLQGPISTTMSTKTTGEANLGVN